MSSGTFETSITAREINEFDFRPGDLDCSVCHKFNEKFCFHHIFMAKYIEKLKRWRISHIGPKPKITCINCYRKNPDPLIIFKCCGCGIEKPLYNFPKNKIGPNDHLSCIACVRKYKKNSATHNSRFMNHEISNSLNPPKKVAPIGQSDSTHYDPEYNYSIPNFEISPSKSKKTDFEMSRTEPSRSDYSDSSYSSISNFSDLTASNKQASYIQDSLNYSLNRPNAINSLSIDKNNDMLQPQVQQQQPQSFKNLNTPKFNTNIYSLSQLIGRKNPPITKNNIISLTIPEEYKTRSSCSINAENSFSFSTSQDGADSTYGQHSSQKPSYNYENIDLYARQIVNSIQNISNNEQKSINTGTNLISPNEKAGTAGILKYAQLARDNNGTGTEERPAPTKPKQVRFNLPDNPNINIENRSQTDTIASTTRYSNQTEQTAQYKQNTAQIPSDINNTAQINNSLHNLPLHSTSSTNLPPSITLGRYRNKNFNLSEIFGTEYNPLPIPPPSNSLSDSSQAFRVNPYISKNHVQVTMQKDNINLQALNPTLNNPIRFGFSTTGGTMKRNFTNFSSS